MSDTQRSTAGIATRCVHGPVRGRHAGEPLVTPIVRSSAFRLGDEAYAQRAAGRADRSLVYGRETNPTVEAVEARLALLEGAERSLLFASGMAALHALLMGVLRSGDRLVSARQLYGGNLSLFDQLLPRIGVSASVVDVADLEGLRRELHAEVRVVFCESISNPLTVVADLAAIKALMREHAPRALLVVDATLASPCAQRPLELGADVAHHSATKTLAGHTDLIGGALSGADELLQSAWDWRTRAGGCMDPEAAFLLERGMKTLALRVARQSENALALAQWLEKHPRVARVHHCGLESDPSHALACRVLGHTGGLFSFVLADGDEAALGLMRRLEIFSEAASLGGVESLISRPVDLSHVHLTAEERQASGIAPGLLRLAVGIEDVDDLIADLERALDAG